MAIGPIDRVPLILNRPAFLEDRLQRRWLAGKRISFLIRAQPFQNVAGSAGDRAFGQTQHFFRTMVGECDRAAAIGDDDPDGGSFVDAADEIAFAA